ncbi:MAG: hypothetical protein JWP38_733 [Herbaspirillum sp.]|nr:hypothetical protein [Herbaspirillum sp.]
MKIPLYLRIVLPLTLIVSGYAMFSDADPGSAAAQSGPVKRVAMRGKTGPGKLPAASSALPALAQQDAVDLFPYQGPRLPDPVPAADAARAGLNNIPPAPPRAPPLPFQFSGVWVDGAQHKYLLSKGDQTTILCQGCDAAFKPAIGDTLFGDYRLDKIDNQRITFTYLPLKLQQVIDLDGATDETGS